MSQPYLRLPKFIPPSMAATLIDYAEENMERLSGDNVNPKYNGLLVRYEDVDDAQVLSIMNMMRCRANAALTATFNSDMIFTESMMINKWPEGSELGDHADNAFFPSGEPNYTSWRTYTAVVYLNDDIEGGEFYFKWEDEEEVISIEQGTLLGFGAGLDYVHGVRPITAGTRWTVPMWFTDQMDRMLSLRSMTA